MTDFKMETIESILRLLPYVIEQEFRSVDKKTCVLMRPFLGIVLNGKFCNGRKYFHPGTLTQELSKDRIKLTAHFTKEFSERINKKDEKC